MKYTYKSWKIRARRIKEEQVFSKARYYNSDLSIWISVDPLADKYPNLSPYTYCANNPVRLVDPDGRTIIIEGENGSCYTYQKGSTCEIADANVQKAWASLNEIYNTNAGESVINEMCDENAPVFKISNNKLSNNNAANFLKDKHGGGTLYLNGQIGSVKYMSHELFHGYQEMSGQGGLSCHNEVEAQLFSFLVCGEQELMPWNGGITTEYWAAYSRIIYSDYSQFDTDFGTLRDGFLDYSFANIPTDNKKHGIYTELQTPKGENNKCLIRKFFISK